MIPLWYLLNKYTTSPENFNNFSAIFPAFLCSSYYAHLRFPALDNQPLKWYDVQDFGELSERFKEPVLKTGDSERNLGFESLTLRQTTPPERAVFLFARLSFIDKCLRSVYNILYNFTYMR